MRRAQRLEEISKYMEWMRAEPDPTSAPRCDANPKGRAHRSLDKKTDISHSEFSAKYARTTQGSFGELKQPVMLLRPSSDNSWAKGQWSKERLLKQWDHPVECRPPVSNVSNVLEF